MTGQEVINQLRRQEHPLTDDVLIETPDGRLLDLQSLDWDEDLQSFVWYTSEFDS